MKFESMNVEFEQSIYHYTFHELQGWKTTLTLNSIMITII